MLDSMIGLNYAVEISPEIDYTLDTIFNALGLPYKKISKTPIIKPETVPVLITYGEYQPSGRLLNYVKNGGYLICIPSWEYINDNEKLLKDDGYKTRTSSKFKLFGYLRSGKIQGLPIFSPFFFTTEKSDKGIDLRLNSPSDYKNKRCISYSKYYKGLIIYLGFDLLYSLYYILTCKHEIDKNQWDRYNRVVEKNNLLLRNNKQNVPWVNLYLQFLENLLQFCFVDRKIPLLKKWYWPDNAGFALWLSHDVDEVKKFTLKKSAMNLMHKKVGDSVAGLGKSIKGPYKDPYWSFFKIMELEKEHGFVSTFFFGALTV